MRFKIFCCHRRRQWILETTQSRKYHLLEKFHWDGKERKGKFYDGKRLLTINENNINATWTENQEKVKFCHQYNCNLIQSLVHLLREIERSKALGVGEAKVETAMH